MGVIQVLEPGLFTTVQDLGREGYGPLGVSPSGAADALSLRMGNRLVGNAEGEAGLEMTLLGGTFAFPDGAFLVMAGSDFGATLDGKPVELWRAVEAKPGQFIAVTDGSGIQLLRRPFSIFTADPETGVCTILFSIYGPTTKAMAALKPGANTGGRGQAVGSRVFENASGCCRHES